MTTQRWEELRATVQILRDRITLAHKRGRPLTEENTKVALISPLLKTLGWNIEDFEEVAFEYRHKSQDLPVDYALFLLRSPCLFVEAKQLDANLSDRRWLSQTIAYASTVGVTWCVLANGDEYRLYNAHAPVDADEKLFRVVKISNSDNDAFLFETLSLLSKENMEENRLSVLWQAHFVDRQVKAIFENLIRRQDESLVRLLHKKTNGLTHGDIRHSLARADLQLDFPAITHTSLPSITSRERVALIEKSQVPTPEPQNLRKRRDTSAFGIRNLIEADIINPPVEIEVKYMGEYLKATIQEDSSILFQSKAYDSLSTAAGMARNSVKGPPKDGRSFWQTNGWTFWKYQDPETGKLEEMDKLRQRCLKSSDDN